MKQESKTPFPCEAFRELVLKKGYSISDSKLSRMAGVPRTTIHHLCTSPEANPRWSTLQGLFGALGYQIAVHQTPWPKKKEVS